MSSVKLKFQENFDGSWVDGAHISALCNSKDVIQLYMKLVRDKEIILLPDQVG